MNKNVWILNRQGGGPFGAPIIDEKFNKGEENRTVRCASPIAMPVTY
jgi:hypothetical protein